MGELRSSTPLRRPDTARARGEAEAAEVAPPSPAELEAIERHLCSLPRHDGATVEQDPDLGALLVLRPDGGAGVNYVAMPRWTSETWRARLADGAARLRAARAWPELLLADRLDRPVGLASALPAAGWRVVHAERVLWVGHASVVPHLDPSLRIEAVQPRDVGDHEALERAIFGFPERLAAERRAALARALAEDGVRAWVVRVDGRPVAVARMSLGEGVAGLYGIGVAEDERRRGLGTLMTTVATRAGMALGKRIVWLSVEEGNEAAMRVYTRLGFQPAFAWSRWMPLDGMPG